MTTQPPAPSTPNRRASTRRPSARPPQRNHHERTLDVRGPFSLRESATFGFGPYESKTFDGVMRLVLTVDGDHDRAAGVAIRQDGDQVRLDITTSADGDAAGDVIAAQVARILSVDHDGTGFAELGRRDPVIGRLQEVAPGLRPPQFCTPYEAAAWSVVSARIQTRQASAIRARMSEQYGEPFEVAGQTLYAFPGPSTLADIDQFPGLTPVKIERLHAVARATLAGQLDVGRLQAMAPDDAMTDVRTLPGIGPFYAALVVLRSCGTVDALPLNEPRARALVHELYGIDHEMSDTEFTEFGRRWAPYRMWATVLIRAAAPRLR